MKIVIYRDKKTNEIKNCHDFRAQCTDENIKLYNENEKYPTKAEVVELEENSLAYYFYTMKTARIENEAEILRDLQDTLESIANRIDDRLYDFDKWFEEERKRNE